MPRQGYYYTEEIDCEATDVNGDGIYPILNPGTSVGLFTFMFDMRDMYPEYLPDSTVLVCPSDIGFTVDDLQNPTTGEFDMFRHCDDGGRGLNLTHGSYVYLAAVFDKCEDEDCNLPYGSLGAGLSLFCADDDAQNPGIIPELCAQFGAWFDWIVVQVTTSPETFEQDLDGEFDLEDDPTFNVAAACPTYQWVGNGGTNTVYRFREGIERYMITDINNAGSGFRGQSQLVLMFDQGSTFVEGFNHIPGGSNLLFLDGHVEFEKYPGQFPLAPNNMWITQCIQTGT
jgi:prepilin-type processing-associated H-X9-DG protein